MNGESQRQDQNEAWKVKDRYGISQRVLDDPRAICSLENVAHWDGTVATLPVRPY